MQHPADDRVADPGWVPLRYFNLYRGIIAGLFLLLGLLESTPRPLGSADPALFQLVSLSYLLFSIACSFAIRMRVPRFHAQVLAQVMIDIVAITLLMHASGGLTSGMGLLLVVAIAGGSLLTEGRIAVLFAALATLAVLGEQIVAWLARPSALETYYHAAMLGAAFFATATLGLSLARRIRASEELAARRELDLASLAQLNEHIIQRMQSGIMALDERSQVRLINTSARRLLGLGSSVEGKYIDGLSAGLGKLLAAWRADSARSSYLYVAPASELRVVVSFAMIASEPGKGVLVFLEDAGAMTQRAQQLKLASLGSLTASIAHEIRNPLGAISHAAQLLGEAPDLDRGERRLTQIIRDNAARMNGIIENVLQLSRRRPAAVESLLLGDWLHGFADDFCAATGIERAQLQVQVQPEDLRVRFDPSQLHQVLSNLCENGVRHGGADCRLQLNAGIAMESRRPVLELSDNGPGVSEEAARQLFEPFFTTRRDGTGLGLYIARELCEGNQASITLVPGVGGARFRITFSDPRRQEIPLE